MYATDDHDTELLEAIVTFQCEVAAQLKKDIPNLAVIHYCEQNIKVLRDERANLKLDQQQEEA
jgi:hypothetical protein